MMLGRSKSRVVDVAEEDELSTNINIAEVGGLTKENKEEDSRVNKSPPKVLLLLSCTFMSLGWIGGPLLTRLYFLHGGNGIWLSSWLQMAGFPILIVPLVILYFRRDRSQPNVDFFVCRKLLLYAALLGLFQGIASYMYSYGLSFLPVSTSSLLFTTQLVSTSFVSYFWVKQKFTPYSINAVVVIIMGCILLGIRGISDHPPGVTKSQYLRGFFISIASASSVGLILVSTQVAYAKANQVMTYPIVLQFQFCFSFFATVSCTVGGLISKDFLEIQKEASEYDLGAKKYYLVLVSMAVVWQLQFIGRAGVIFCTSSLFAGVVGATILPFSQIAAVITFHESFTAEKGMALALTLWGFTSYFYGSYMNKTKARITSITP
ncbi:hypothetical protein C5167_012127 [Papaver somniferum]|uniref:Probable purine permease n=1 Tax=Papaver somniferum TaxID=3469 RepID=A0A4Y7IZT1_PAPSO|nr:purine permease 3-like [Papaver somniferum]RZC53272.1 hypothetical protein C5167_012127 [Papaver somniferum]